MYSMGGWMIMPQSCSKGFRSLPSAGPGNSRKNGLDVINSMDRKPTEIRPKTPSTRETISSGKVREKVATATVQTAKIIDQNNSEPSCDPQVAVN